jgi:hypothetical protein
MCPSPAATQVFGSLAGIPLDIHMHLVCVFPREWQAPLYLLLMIVMAALDAAIHEQCFAQRLHVAWMRGSRPRMTSGV